MTTYQESKGVSVDLLAFTKTEKKTDRSTKQTGSRKRSST